MGKEKTRSTLTSIGAFLLRWFRPLLRSLLLDELVPILQEKVNAGAIDPQVDEMIKVAESFYEAGRNLARQELSELQKLAEEAGMPKEEKPAEEKKADKKEEIKKKLKEDKDYAKEVAAKHEEKE